MQMNLRCFSGFTLIELAVVFAVTAIMATFSTPLFVVSHKRDQIDVRAHTMMSTLMLARSQAIRRGARLTLCRIDAARACLTAGKPLRRSLDGSCWSGK
jgi:type IV fimbrial biogenesis protein FimT